MVLYVGVWLAAVRSASHHPLTQNRNSLESFPCHTSEKCAGKSFSCHTFSKNYGTHFPFAAQEPSAGPPVAIRIPPMKQLRRSLATRHPSLCPNSFTCSTYDKRRGRLDISGPLQLAIVLTCALYFCIFVRLCSASLHSRISGVDREPPLPVPRHLPLGYNTDHPLPTRFAR